MLFALSLMIPLLVLAVWVSAWNGIWLIALRTT